jgi:gliding-associated putative ABC transporter substrate-binding component GldG
MKLKKMSYSTNYILLVVLVAGILGVINVLSYRHFLRFDLTENKQYTISASTKKVLAGLDDIVNIKVYFSQKLPPYLSNLTDQVNDFLDEYRTYAKGNLNIEFIDPATDPAMEQKLRFMGIPQVRLNVIERDQAQFTNVYLGMAVLYGDNKEVIPAITDTSNFEYDLTSKILRVTSTEVKTIGFLSGQGGPDITKELKNIQSALQEHYSTRMVETKNQQQISPEVSALVVAGPKQLSDHEKFLIDQYIMSGGNVLFLVDTVSMDERRLFASPLNTPVADLLEHYGVKVKNELVLDRANASASFQSGYFTISVPYPFWVKIVKENFASTHPLVNQLESMVLPWASPLEIMQDKIPGVQATELAKSSQYSWIQKDFYDLSPKEEYNPAQQDMKTRIMAVALSGKFKSFFADKAVPPLEKEKKPEPEKEKPAADKAAKTTTTIEQETKPVQQPAVIKEGKDAKIIVVGNSRFIAENFPLEFEGNRIFFLNVIDWFTIGDYLIGIRSRESTDRPLTVIPDKARTVIRFINVFGVSILLAGFGLVQLYARRRRKRLGITGI